MTVAIGTSLREIVAGARLDFGDVLRSRWLPLSSGVYAVLAAGLVLVGLRESSVLGFSGMGRVMLSFAHVLLVVLPLLALSATVQVVARAREDGTLELLFGQPLSRSSYLVSVTLVRYGVLLVPLAILLFIMALIGGVAFGEEIPVAMLGRTLAVGAALLWAFVGIGVLVSVRTRHTAKAVVAGLVVWALAVAILDLGIVGLLLNLRLSPHAVFALAGANPVQAARLALLSGIEPDLGTLGPVGFFLAHQVGASGLLAYGLAWPLVVGTLAWAFALRSFSRGDLV